MLFRALSSLEIGRDIRDLLALFTRGQRRRQAAGQLRALLTSNQPLDLVRGLLLVAWEADPDMDLEAAEETFAILAIRCRKHLGDVRKPEAVVERMNRFLFEVEGFRAEAEPSSPGGMERLLLHRVIERRSGTCVGLSCLYLALAHRLKLPIYGVNLPRHFFVRYVPRSGSPINIETTAEGRSFPDAHYVKRYRLKPRHVERGIYLSNLGKRQVLVEVLNNLGNVQYRSGRIRRALAQIDRATEHGTNFAAGHFGRAYIYHRQGDLIRAISEYERGLEIDADFVAGLLNAGDAHLQVGDLERAEELFERARELEPGHPLVHSNLGRIKNRLKKNDEAIEHHRRALDLNPELPQVWTNLGVAFHAQGENEKAIRAFKQALKIRPGFIAARENLATLYLETNRWIRGRWAARAVIRTYRQKIRENPQAADVYHALARFLEGTNLHLTEALRQAEAANRLRPDFPPYLETLAAICYKLKNYPRAIARLKKLLDMGPGRLPRPRHHYEALLKRYREAQGLLEEG